MGATNYTALIATLRREGGDTAGTSVASAALSNIVQAETPQGDVDGVNTIFYLANQNIVKGTVGGYNYGPFLTLSTPSTIRSASGFTVDAVSGIITMTAAPASGQAKFYFNYWFQWYADADYNTFIDSATEELGSPAGTAVIENLYPSLVQYSLVRYWTKRAGDYANKYATSGGGGSEQVQTVTQNFLSLAKFARKQGDDMRKTAYSDPGKKMKPSSGTITYGISPYTPRT